MLALGAAAGGTDLIGIGWLAAQRQAAKCQRYWLEHRAPLGDDEAIATQLAVMGITVCHRPETPAHLTNQVI
jgi:hypothetical protein